MDYDNIPADDPDEQQITNTERTAENVGGGNPSSPGEWTVSADSVDELLAQYEQIENGGDETTTNNQARPST